MSYLYLINEYGGVKLHEETLEIIGTVSHEEIHRVLIECNKAPPFVLSPEILAHELIPGGGHKIAFGIAPMSPVLRVQPGRRDQDAFIKVNLPAILAIFSITPGFGDKTWLLSASTLVGLKSTRIHLGTECHRLMLPNIGDDGHICWNSVSLSNKETDPLIFCKRYVTQFFASRFNNHLNPDGRKNVLEKMKEREAGGGRFLYCGSIIGSFEQLWTSL